ncbi:mannosyltransferase [Panus rudis PR-1116 ss-1]|nr:mannosyltransferase [Panus rudis PR-1116 ss-1]
MATTSCKADEKLVATRRAHVRQLQYASILTWLFGAALLLAASHLPLFDSSPKVLLDVQERNLYWYTTYSLLRWDVFHYGHIAKEGYVYDYEWAFLPGLPIAMRTGARVISWLGISTSEDVLSWGNLLTGGLLLSLCCGTTTTLYDLTLELTGSPNIAFLSALLSLLPSSPATLRFVPYTEPFFTYLSYQGMLHCARLQWFSASIFFTLAGAFRSNGFMLSGFLLWGLLAKPVLERRTVPPTYLFKATLLTALTFGPFVYHQYSAFLKFCRNHAVEMPPWCLSVPPSIYTHVQAKYWDNGFLRYWTPAQIPNFLISIPVLVSLLWFSVYHIRMVLIPRLVSLTHTSRPPLPAKFEPLLSPNITPHAIHAFIFTNVLLFASNTQIILRLAASMPFTYWSAAYLLIQKPSWGKWWVTWSVVWGAISIILWATFLPPA